MRQTVLRRFVHKAFFTVLLLTWLDNSHVCAQATKESKVGLYERFADTTIAAFAPSRTYYLATWKHGTSPPPRIIRRLGENAAIVAINTGPAFELMKTQVNLVGANDDWKLSPAAFAAKKRNDRSRRRFTVSGINLEKLTHAVKSLATHFTITRSDAASNSIMIEGTTEAVSKYLLSHPGIIFIDLPATAHVEANIIGYDRSFHGLSAVDYSIPGANGKNIVAGVKEQRMERADLDLYKRVLPSPLEAPAITNHATVIASIIGGAGNSFYDGRGIAYRCRFFPSSFANLFADDAGVLASNKVTVQNHSYGTVVQQFYGAEAVSYDALAWSNPTFVAIFSAGNQGLAAATDGPYANIAGYANLTGNFKMAKNVVTVGAISKDGAVPGESSAGPLYDGRIAPQLIALGPNGTSDAAAVVSGSAAVLQQVYADSNNNELPPASLVKALLYNSAEDIHVKGIDYKTGYGLVNSYAAIRALQQKQFVTATISEGQEWVRNLTIPAGAAAFKITLCWTDTTASVNNNKALLNDLDLELVEPVTGRIFQPWVLNPSANLASLAAPATRKTDSLNTAEQVSIRLPRPGTYQVKVKGRIIPSGQLPFSIAFHTDTLNSFEFLSPQHASDVIREEKPATLIKWKTFVADSSATGNLFISYNRGVSWQLLEQSLKIYTNQYSWQLPDTVSTAQLKMETGFGNFFSKEFMLGRVIRPVVDFVCTDSFRLSWASYPYANGYRVFSLADSPYLQEIVRVKDTFVVVNRSVHTSRVYAVEPVLINGISTARSIAIDVQQQGVQCFYRTLNYNLLDLNKLNLILEISAPSYTDSVYFEQVTAGGQLIQTYGGSSVNANTSVYTKLVDEVQTGFTYLRGKIRLKSGAVVYTDIIPVLTSGNKVLRFYPNPVQRNSPLRRVLQQGTLPGNTLQFFDVSGRLIKTFPSIPDEIDVSGFPAGVVIFKLIDGSGVLLETGKIIVN